MVDVGLFAALAVADKAYDWSLIDLPWWAWLVLASPALLLDGPAARGAGRGAEPGRRANGSIALLGLLVVADVFAVGVLLVALASSDASSLSAGDLLAHGAVVWLSNIITFGLLFWELDEGGPRLRAERGRRDPDFQFPQDADGTPAGTHG